MATIPKNWSTISRPFPSCTSKSARIFQKFRENTQSNVSDQNLLPVNNGEIKLKNINTDEIFCRSYFCDRSL